MTIEFGRLASRSTKKYRAFISYSHCDRKWAQWLHRRLESYRLPKHVPSRTGQVLPKRLAPVFLDRDELPTSSSLSDAVGQALEDSEALIVVCSPHAVASRWVNEEIRTFRQIESPERIFCFIVDGEPNSGDERECFPAALVIADERTDPILEPAAADVRSQADGRKNAFLKIVAGILGVGFDDLRQRDHHRFQRKLTAIAAASFLLAAVMVVLAITATLARQDADFRREQAEDLIDYMLGDLHHQMREIGRLDIYESVGNKAFEYFSALSVEDASEYTLAQSAKNLRQIGEVRMDQGDLTGALDAYEESLAITARLARESPENDEVQIGHANSIFYVGYIHWQRGELVAARQRFEDVLPIVDVVSERNPQSARFLLERSFAYTNLGRVLELDGALDAALQAYTSVMHINTRLADLEPGNPEYEVEVGFAHNNIGKLVTSLGRLEEAESHYRLDLEIKLRILDSNPDHNIWRAYVAVSHYFLGQLLVLTGESVEAEEHLLTSLGILQFLIEANPDRKEWIARRANVELDLGSLAGYAGNLDQASDYLSRSVEALQELLNFESSNVRWRSDLARGLLLSTNIAVQAGDPNSAIRSLELANEHIQAIVEVDPNSQAFGGLKVFANICEAKIAAYRNSNDLEVAANRALEIIDRRFPDTSDPRILDMKAQALRWLHREHESVLIEEQLSSIGYAAKFTD